MSEVTVSQLASDVGIPVDRLLKQLSDAGIAKQSAEDVITEQEKVDLLNHLRRSHGKNEKAAAGGRKIALKRKTTTELHQPASGRTTARSPAARAA
jgi:translation initiation factor IF-2